MIQLEMAICAEPVVFSPHSSPFRSRRACSDRNSPTDQHASIPCALEEDPGMIDIPAVAFWVLAAALVGSALAVVFLRNIVHAALFLVVVFGAAAGIYVLLNAEFIAIVQILIYAGAVAVLVLFAIMLTQNSMSDRK